MALHAALGFEKITYGDLISFYIHDNPTDKGFVAFLAPSDVIEEHNAPTSQLKAIPPANSLDNSERDKLNKEEHYPEDFQTRCVFQILDDSGEDPNEAIVYGSMVKLLHFKTDFTLTVREIHHDRQRAVLPCLQKIESLHPVPESLFQILPRFSMRLEGDFVHTRDLVVFRNVQFPLYRFTARNAVTEEESRIICEKQEATPDEMDMEGVQGWEIFRVRALYNEEEKEEEKQDTSIFVPLRGGDFVTLFHQDMKGQLICRIDDGWERSVGEGNLGLVCRKLQKSDQTACYVRRGKDKDSVLGVWQVLHRPVLNGSEVLWGDQVRLRHVVTGRYLAIRCLNKSDTRDLQEAQVPVKDIPLIDKRRESLFWMVTSESLGVGTMDDAFALETLFEFIPVVEKQTGAINLESSFILRHAETGVHFKVIREEEDGALETDSELMRPESQRHIKVIEDLDDLFENVYTDDFKLQPAMSTVQKEVYKVKPVPLHVAHDLQFLLRFRPLLWALVHRLRELDLDEMLPSKEVANSINAFLAIKNFVVGTINPSAVFEQQTRVQGISIPLVKSRTRVGDLGSPSFRSEHFETTRSRQSSHSVNDGSPRAARGEATKAPGVSMTPFTRFTNSLTELQHLISQDDKSTVESGNVTDEEIVKHRQDITREINLIEPMLQILNLCFVRHRIEVEECVEDSAETGEIFFPSRDKDMDNLCKNVYSMLEVLLRNNPSNTRQVIALGGLSLMIAHLPMGWAPPLKALLMAMVPTSASSSPAAFDFGAFFSRAQMHQLSHQLYEARKSQDWVVCSSILELFSLFCCSDGNANEAMQTFVRSQLFHEDPVSGAVYSMLFNTRTYSADEPAWQVAHRRLSALRPDSEHNLFGISSLPTVGISSLKFRKKSTEVLEEKKEMPKKILKYEISTDLIFEAPKYLPHEDEVQEFLENEREYMETCFGVYDVDGSGGIDNEELTLLLEDLGVINPYIEDHLDEVGSGDEANFEELLQWWQSHRQIFNIQADFILKGEKEKNDELKNTTDEIGAAESKESEVAVPGDEIDKEDRGEIKEDIGLPAEGKAPEAEEPKGFKRFFTGFGNRRAKSCPNPSPPALFSAKNSDEEKKKDEKPEKEDALVQVEDTETPVLLKDTTSPPRSMRGKSALVPENWDDACSLYSRKDATNISTGLFQWLYGSMELILALANGRNYETQRIISSILPIDMILDVMSASKAVMLHKHQYCQVLQALYVEHDMVFPLRPLYVGQAAAMPASLSTITIGEDGAVFNRLTQGIGQKIRTPQEQRSILRNLILQTLPVLGVNVSGSVDPHRLSFTNAFLNLVRGLVKVGFFFQDQEMSGFEAHQNLASQLISKLDEASFEKGRREFSTLHPSFLETHYSTLFSNIYCIEAKRKVLEVLGMIQQILLIDLLKNELSTSWKERLEKHMENFKPDLLNKASEYHVIDDHEIINYLNDLMEKIIMNNLGSAETLLGPLNMCLLHQKQNLTFRSASLLYQHFFPVPLLERLLTTTAMVTDPNLAATVHCTYVWDDLLKKYFRYFRGASTPQTQELLCTLARAIKILPIRFWSSDSTLWMSLEQEIQSYPLGMTEDSDWQGHRVALILHGHYHLKRHAEGEQIKSLTESFRLAVQENSDSRRPLNSGEETGRFLVDAPLREHQILIQRGLSETLSTFLLKEGDVSNFKGGTPIQEDILDSLFTGLWALINGNAKHAEAISVKTFKMVLYAARKFPSAAVLLKELLQLNPELRQHVGSEHLLYFVGQVKLQFPNQFDFLPIWVLSGIFTASVKALEKLQLDDETKGEDTVTFRKKNVDNFTFKGMRSLLKEFHTLIFQKKMLKPLLDMSLRNGLASEIYRRDALHTAAMYLKLSGEMTHLQATQQMSDSSRAFDEKQDEELDASIRTDVTDMPLHVHGGEYVGFETLYMLLKTGQLGYFEKEAVYYLYGCQIGAHWQEHELTHIKTIRLLHHDLRVLLDGRSQQTDPWILELTSYVKSGVIPFLECVISHVPLGGKNFGHFKKIRNTLAKLSWDIADKPLNKRAARMDAWINPMAEDTDAEEMTVKEVYVSVITMLSQLICWVESLQGSLLAEPGFEERVSALLQHCLEVDPAVTFWQRQALQMMGRLRFEENARDNETTALILSSVNWRKTIRKCRSELKLPDSITASILSFYQNAFNDYIIFVEDHKNHHKNEDFKNWSWGFSRFLVNLLEILPALTQSRPDMANFFLRIFTDIVQEKANLVLTNGNKNSETIRANQAALAQVQGKLAELGGLTTVQLILTTAEEGFSEDQSVILRSALRLGELLLLQGNQLNQNDIILGIQHSGLDRRTNDMELRSRFLGGLQHLLRELRQRIETQRVTQGKAEEVQPWMIALSKSLLDFLTAMAFGDNASAKDFLRRQKGRDSVNIVMEVSHLISSVTSLLTNFMCYIKDPIFNQISPEIPGSNGRTRNFVCWHNPETDFLFIKTLFDMLTSGFRALSEFISGPNLENQVICRRAATLAADLMEYAGGLHLELPAQVKGEVWRGDDPYLFYSLLVRNIDHAEQMQKNINPHFEKSDPRIKDFYHRIAPEADLIRGTKHKCSCWCWHKPVEVDTLSKASDVLGVNVQEFVLSAAHCETELVTLILGLVDGQDSNSFAHFLDCWPLLLQNMNSTLILGRANAGEGYHDSQVSGYLTLLNWVQSNFATTAEGKSLKQHLFDWEKGITRQIGIPLRDIISSVEVNSKDEKLIRIYFPVPAIVQKHWTLPEIQSVKQTVLYTVNRETPEERVQDFYKKRNNVTDALKMQAVISRTLGPLHMFFGGRSPGWMAYLPTQRGFLLFQTLFQNVFLLYETYQEDFPLVSDNSILATIKNWEYEAEFWIALGIIHNLNCLSLLTQFMLNSSAICRAFRYETRNPTIKRLVAREDVQYMVRGFGALYESKWMAVMLFASVMGCWNDHLWYALCVMDVVFQIRMMSFLLSSITRNLNKLFLTIVLSLVVLYEFSLIAYQVFTDEYSFSDKHDCQTFLTCFMLHVGYGWLEAPVWDSDGMINPYFEGSSSSDEGTRLTSQSLYTAFAVFVQIAYIIIVNLVLSAIISGLIIDTFSEMRTENEMIEKDIIGNCFICGIDRDDFERAGVNFNSHTTHHHNMWKYLQLELYLENKDKGSYSGQDIYLAQMYSTAESFVSLMPVKKAMILESQKLKEKNDLATLFSKVSKIDKKAEAMVKEQQESLTGLDVLHAAHKERKRENKMQTQEMTRIQKNQDNFQKKLNETDVIIQEVKDTQAEIIKLILEEKEARLESERKAKEAEEAEKKKGFFSS